MEFTNSFAVDVPLEHVWALLLDAEQVAPCVPGAELTESTDDLHHRGIVKIKLGAVQMTYRGELEMQPDEATRTIVLKARGSESRGGGGASGTFTTTLTPTDAGGTQVDIHTRVDVTGRVAQFGRGIMQDVANRMIKDFAACLERRVSEGSGGLASETPNPTGPHTPPVQAEMPAAPPPAGDVATGSAPRPGPAGNHRPPPPPAPVRSPSAPTEIRVGKLLLDITRTRIADCLRFLAKVVEP